MPLFSTTPDGEASNPYLDVLVGYFDLPDTMIAALSLKVTDRRCRPIHDVQAISRDASEMSMFLSPDFSKECLLAAHNAYEKKK